MFFFLFASCLSFEAHIVTDTTELDVNGESVNKICQANNIEKIISLKVTNGIFSFIDFDRKYIKEIKEFVVPAESFIGLIPENFFKDCTHLNKVIMDGAKIIDEGVFQNTPLQEISFKQVKDIKRNAFKLTESFNITHIDVEFPVVASIEENCFENSIFRKISLPNCTRIDSAAFKGSIYLEEVYIPKLQTINSQLFYNCENLTNITFSPMLSKVYSEAFVNCHKIVNISFPNVVSIDNSAFANCSSLANIDLPLVRTVNTLAFSYCDSLETINLPNCTKVYFHAFSFNSKLQIVKLVNLKTIICGEGYSFMEPFEFSNVSYIYFGENPPDIQKSENSVIKSLNYTGKVLVPSWDKYIPQCKTVLYKRRWFGYDTGIINWQWIIMTIVIIILVLLFIYLGYLIIKRLRITRKSTKEKSNLENNLIA